MNMIDNPSKKLLQIQAFIKIIISMNTNKIIIIKLKVCYRKLIK